jgi:hypothetical protein
VAVVGCRVDPPPAPPAALVPAAADGWHKCLPLSCRLQGKFVAKLVRRASVALSHPLVTRRHTALRGRRVLTRGTTPWARVAARSLWTRMVTTRPVRLSRWVRVPVPFVPTCLFCCLSKYYAFGTITTHKPVRRFPPLHTHLPPHDHEVNVLLDCVSTNPPDPTPSVATSATTTAAAGEPPPPRPPRRRPHHHDPPPPPPHPPLPPPLRPPTCPQRPTGSKFVADVPRYVYNDYTLGTEVLGNGISGAVRVVQSRATGQKFALRAIHLPAGGLPQAAKASLEREVNALMALEHRGVVKLHDVYRSADSVYLVMDQCSGPNLQDYTAKLDREERVRCRRVFCSSFFVLFSCSIPFPCFPALLPLSLLLRALWYCWVACVHALAFLRLRCLASELALSMCMRECVHDALVLGRAE